EPGLQDGKASDREHVRVSECLAAFIAIVKIPPIILKTCAHQRRQIAENLRIEYRPRAIQGGLPVRCEMPQLNERPNAISLQFRLQHDPVLTGFVENPRSEPVEAGSKISLPAPHTVAAVETAAEQFDSRRTQTEGGEH